MEADKIKRVAQFLFDNAVTIETELAKTENYRSIGIHLNMFKTDNAKNLEVEMNVYDSSQGQHQLRGDAICLYKFKQLFKQINEDCGQAPLPKPAKLRDKL